MIVSLKAMVQARRCCRGIVVAVVTGVSFCVKTCVGPAVLPLACLCAADRAHKDSHARGVCGERRWRRNDQRARAGELDLQLRARPAFRLPAIVERETRHSRSRPPCVPEPYVIDVFGSVSGLGMPTTEPSVEV